MGASFVAIRIGGASRGAACLDPRHGQQSEASSRPGSMSNQVVGADSQDLGMPGARPLQLRVCGAVWFRQFLSPSESTDLREDGGATRQLTALPKPEPPSGSDSRTTDGLPQGRDGAASRRVRPPPQGGGRQRISAAAAHDTNSANRLGPPLKNEAKAGFGHDLVST